MINNVMGNLSNNRFQQGMATLVITISVLIIITLMVIFATKVGIFDLRMAANEARYKEAFATGEGGLDFAIQKFEDQFRNDFSGTASWATIISNSQIANGTTMDGTTAGVGDTSFGVTVTDTGALIGGISVFHFQSTGLSADASGTATIHREITMKKILGGQHQKFLSWQPAVLEQEVILILLPTQMVRGMEYLFPFGQVVHHPMVMSLCKAHLRLASYKISREITLPVVIHQEKSFLRRVTLVLIY